MNITKYITRQLKEKEELANVVHQHWLVIIPLAGAGAVLVLLDFFLISWWFSHHWWGALGWLVVLVVGGLLVARAIYTWSRNVFALTNQRVISVDQRGFFEHHVAEATYDKIRDVSYSIRGFWPTVCHFGTINLQTGGSEQGLSLRAVADPVRLQQEIYDLQRRANPSNNDLTAAELVGVVDKLKRELGEEGIQRLINRQSRDHAEQDRPNLD